jgi:hypothetical protein
LNLRARTRTKLLFQLEANLPACAAQFHCDVGIFTRTDLPATDRKQGLAAKRGEGARCNENDAKHV